MVNIISSTLSRLRSQPPRRESFLESKSDIPLAYFFDGKSFSTVNHHNRAADQFSGYGMSAAVLRPGKLQPTDWDFARAYIQCEYAFRSVEMVAADLASIPHGVRRVATGEDWPDHPLMNAFTWARRVLGQDIISLWEKALYVFGESYLLPINNGFKNPETGQAYYNGLQWLNPLAMEPFIINGRLERYDYSAYGNIPFRPSEIVHDKLSSMFDDLRGQSPMAAALAAVNIDIEIKRYTLDSFMKDMRMSGILTGREGSNLSQTDLNAALDQLKQKKEARMIALAPALVWQQVQHEWNDTQFKASDDARRRITTALGIPMSVVGAWDDAHYQSAPAQLEFYYDKVVFRECDRMSTFIADVLMPYFDPWGEGEFYYDKEAVHMPGEDKRAKTDIVNSRLAAGNLMINEAREKLGDKPIEGGDVFVINGQIISATQLANLAKQPAAPLLPDTTLTTPPALPAPAPEKAVEPTAQPGMKSVYMGLTFPNHPDLMGLQSRVKELVGVGECQWNDPADFHITLMYAPAVTDEQLAGLTAALEDIDVPDMALRIGSLGIFDNVGQHAVHFKIRRSVDLYELQAELHEICSELGIPMSSYSTPENYKPHITMGYANDKVKAVTFKGNLKVKPHSLCLKADDQTLHEIVIGVQPIEPDDPPPAQKTAGKGALLMQDEVHFIEDMPSKPCRNCRWFSRVPNTLPCNLVINSPLLITPESHCDRFELLPEGSTVNVYIEDASPDNPNRQIPPIKSNPEPPSPEVVSVALEQELAAMAADPDIQAAIVPDETFSVYEPEPEPPKAVNEVHEKLTSWGKVIDTWHSTDGKNWINDARPGESITTDQYPNLTGMVILNDKGELVAQARSLKTEPEPQTIHAAALDELAAWQKKVKNKGATKALDFKNYLIPDDVAERLRLNLNEIPLRVADEDGQAAAIKVAFDAAREALSIKSIQVTRSDFEDAFSSLLADALKGSINRRQFQGRLKSMIETYGYKAYIDGLRDGGIEDDPTTDESATVVSMITAQSPFISSLATTIYKDEETIITDALAEQKPTLWYNKSINPFYLAGLAEADANGLYEWVYGDTEHCETCNRMNGQKHRMAEYTSKGILPQSDSLDCKGFNCKCNLVKTTGRARGSW